MANQPKKHIRFVTADLANGTLTLPVLKHLVEGMEAHMRHSEIPAGAEIEVRVDTDGNKVTVRTAQEF